MRRLSMVILALALTAPVACKKKPEAPEPVAPPAPIVVPTGFQHDPKFDVDGYYLPVSPVQVGNIRLVNIAMGAESDFTAFEQGEREGLFGPIFIDFEDVTSPVTTNELGQESHKTRSRAAVESFRMFPGEVSFAAKDALAGEIRFAGRFDQAALAKARTERSGEAPVLTGALQVGAQRFEDARFTYFAGD